MVQPGCMLVAFRRGACRGSLSSGWCLQRALEILRAGLQPAFEHAKKLGIHDILAATIGMMRLWFVTWIYPQNLHHKRPGLLAHTRLVVCPLPLCLCHHVLTWQLITGIYVAAGHAYAVDLHLVLPSAPPHLNFKP